MKSNVKAEQGVITRISQAIMAHAGKVARADDMTLLVVRRNL